MKIFNPFVLLRELYIPSSIIIGTTNALGHTTNNTDLSNTTFINNIEIFPNYYLNNTYKNQVGHSFGLEYIDFLEDYKNNNDTYRNDIIAQEVELGADFQRLFYMESQKHLSSSLNSTKNQPDQIIECYKHGIFIPCPKLISPSLPQHLVLVQTVDLDGWGTFEIYDTNQPRDMRKVVYAMHHVITRMEEMFGKELIHSGNVTAHKCTVDISPPPKNYGESGVYPSQNHNDHITCQIRASSYTHSDYSVLKHEMFHALFNGFLGGKYESMPRMFTEGWADVAGGTSHGSSRDALNKIASYSSIDSLSDLFQVLRHQYYDNYVLGAQYFHFCRHSVPDALPRYVNKIRVHDSHNWYDHGVHDLIDIASLEQKCSLADFMSWLQNPDYTIIINNQYYDMKIVCNNGVNQILRCKQQPKIDNPEEVTSQYCSKAYDITPFLNDRVVFSHSQGIVVITKLENAGFTFLHKIGANIEKHVCVRGVPWLNDKIKTIDNYDRCTDADTIKEEIVNAVKLCMSQIPTADDISIFPDNIGITTTTTSTTTTIVDTNYANQDIIIICDPEQGSSSYICPAPRQQIPMLEQYIKYNCSAAIGDNLTNRIIYDYGFNDMKVITFQKSGVEFITRKYNIFEKYFCGSDLRDWVEQSVKPIIHNKGSNCKSTMRAVESIGEQLITVCKAVSLSTRDIDSLASFVHDKDSAAGSTNSIQTILYVVGSLGIIGVGVGVGVWMCKKTQSKNTQPIEYELTALNSNQMMDMDVEKTLEMHHARNIRTQNELHNMHNKQWDQYSNFQHTRNKLKLQLEMNKQELAKNAFLHEMIIKSQENNITQNVDLSGDDSASYSEF